MLEVPTRNPKVCEILELRVRHSLSFCYKDKVEIEISSPEMAFKVLEKVQ
jgi:hypothetical protein